MTKGKTTGRKAASNASKTLTDESTGSKSKTSAGSALSQTDAPEKSTSKSASKVVSDGRTSKASKSAAGSALSQKEGAKGSKGGSKKTSAKKS